MMVKSMYDKPIDKFLAIAGEMLRSEAAREAPVIKGRLRGDITVLSQHSGEITVGNTALIDYAKYVYFGTKPHTIKPKRKKALKTPFGAFKKVNHPGTKANPYLDRALEGMISSGKLNRLLDGFADDMSEVMFKNISEGFKNIKVK